MDRKQFFKLVKEAKNNFRDYTPEQQMRILEKIEKLNTKLKIDENYKNTKSPVDESADFLEEK